MAFVPRSRVVVLVGLLAIIAAALVFVIQRDDEGADTAPDQAAPKSIVSYLERDEGGHVTVPDGEYRGGSVSTSRSDWLVLEAESPGGVVVDLSETGLELDHGTNKVVFVGFKFVNGMVRLAGVEDVSFWYCEFTFPPEEWFRQYTLAGGTAPVRSSERSGPSAEMANPHPTAIRMRHGDDGERNLRVGVYGSDLHDLGDDGVFLGHAQSVRLEGLRIWDVDDKQRYDPGERFAVSDDWFHNDSIQAVAPTSEVVIADSWLGEKVQWGTSNGTIAGARFERLWIAGSRTFGQLSVLNGTGKILDTTQTEIRAFANGQNRGSYVAGQDRFRSDFVDGEQVAIWPAQHREKGVFEIRARQVVDTVPLGITTRAGVLTDLGEIQDHRNNPANRWRAQHPYASWVDYLALDT
jgi:hypothetical protein